MSTEPSTPLMRQYHSVKQQVPNALLMFRLGDFYELFYDDAVTAARELEITLTSRSKEKGQGIPMCGVPHHAAEGYLARLIQKGYRVAICEQMEDPRFTKKLVKREITRVVTPGTVTDSAVLRSHENNFLAAAIFDGVRAGLAHADVSTGEFRVTEVDSAEVGAALENLRAREVLVMPGAPALSGVRTEIEDWVFTFDYAERTLRDHFHLLSLDGCGLEGKRLATCAAGAILHYIRDTQKSALDHLDRPSFYDRAGAMILDGTTIRNLELVEPIFSAEGKESTLLSVLDETATGMGGRLLRRWLLRPSLELAEIESRLDAVEELLKDTIGRTELRKTLASILDLERLLAKVTLGSAGPREVLALGRSLEKVPIVKSSLAQVKSERLAALRDRLDELADVRDQILNGLSEEPPLHLGDGDTIRKGFHAELDELRDLRLNSKQYIAQIEQRERTRSNIGSLKVRFNNVFGYYIEISKANLHLVPTDYERKQTLVNAERFTTPELKELEVKILAAEEKILELERQIFSTIRSATAAQATRIRETGTALGELDVLASFAELSSASRYTRPRFSNNGELRIAGGRHPVIERLTERDAVRFIPNDLALDSEREFVAVITGP